MIPQEPLEYLMNPDNLAYIAGAVTMISTSGFLLKRAVSNRLHRLRDLENGYENNIIDKRPTFWNVGSFYAREDELPWH